MGRKMGVLLLNCLVHMPIKAVSLRASVKLAKISTSDVCLTSQVKI